MAFSTKGPKLATSMTTMVPEEEEVGAEDEDPVPFRVVEITNAIYIHYCRIHTIGVNYLDWLDGWWLPDWQFNRLAIPVEGLFWNVFGSERS